MTIKIYTDDKTFELNPAINISVNDIYKQLDEGNLIVIDTIDRSTFIINCINIVAIKIINNNLQK